MRVSSSNRRFPNFDDGETESYATDNHCQHFAADGSKPSFGANGAARALLRSAAQDMGISAAATTGFNPPFPEQRCQVRCTYDPMSRQDKCTSI